MPTGPYGAAILDTFTRADENPNSGGGNWPGKIETGLSALKVVSNQLAANGAGSSGYWLTSFPGTVQAGFKVTSKPAGNATHCRLYICLSNVPSAAENGYMMEITALSGTDDVSLFPVTAGVTGSTLGGVAVEYAVNDSFAFARVGGNLEAWRHDGTSWTKIKTVADPGTYSSGFTGLMLYDGAATVDDWFAGAVVFPHVAPYPALLAQ